MHMQLPRKDAMKTSDAGIEFIKTHEGLRLTSYDDGAGFMTIGWGHKMDSSESRADITLEQAEYLLGQDLALAESDVNTELAAAEFEVNQNQFDALVDFRFNLGKQAVAKLLSHGYAQIPSQIPLWIHAGGKVMGGLVTRRQDEVELWNS
jgi:lysozyme